MGGHSNSGHDWMFANGEITVRTDGFAISPNGYVVEGLEVETSSPQKTSGKDLSWMGTVQLGMPSTLVRTLTKHLPPPKVVESSWTWTQRGYAEPQHKNGGDPYKLWTARLQFAGAVLVGIYVDCS